MFDSRRVFALLAAVALGRVDIHLSSIWIAAKFQKAKKLRAVFS